ncbi:MAG: right-handed parallel beta-helix repeat-containing protein [Desulfofustis sp.]|nr:right-handed parallel beta-helix repeat-containing protein [Desulfofustis sp.]
MCLRFFACLLVLVAVAAGTPTALAGFCEPLAPSVGPTESVASESQIRDRAYNAPAGTTLLIAPGTYSLTSYIHIVNDGVSLRGATGNRDEVILDFGGMVGGQFGVLVDGDQVVLADLTIRNTTDHGVSIQGADNPTLYNLHIVDSNDQLVKVNPVGDGSEDGLLACSLLEYTTSAPDTYTNGISAHNAQRWVVRDNVWRRIRTSSDDVPVQTILFWSGSRDTVVERNLLIDCSRGIAFGDSSHGPGDHLGGIVRNNIMYSRLPHDTAIEMVHATGWLVAHNTVLLLDPLPGLSWGIEARYADTAGTFANNLTNMTIWENRDGSEALAGSDNIETADPGWLVDPESLDFRLTTRAGLAIDRGSSSYLGQIPADFHGELRDATPDTGADEWQPGLSDVIEMLRILAGLAGSSALIDDINNDGVIGLAEAIHLLTWLVGSE